MANWQLPTANQKAICTCQPPANLHVDPRNGHPKRQQQHFVSHVAHIVPCCCWAAAAAVAVAAQALNAMSTSRCMQLLQQVLLLKCCRQMATKPLWVHSPSDNHVTPSATAPARAPPPAPAPAPVPPMLHANSCCFWHPSRCPRSCTLSLIILVATL